MMISPKSYSLFPKTFIKFFFLGTFLKKNTVDANNHLRYWYIFPKGLDYGLSVQCFFMSRDPLTKFS